MSTTKTKPAGRPKKTTKASSNRTTIFLTERTKEALGEVRSPDPTKKFTKGEGLSGRIARLADRYDVLVVRARRTALPQLAPLEREALLDAFRPPYNLRERTPLELIEDIVSRPQDVALAGQLPAGASGMVAKLSEMTDVQRIALVEWIERELGTW